MPEFPGGKTLFFSSDTAGGKGQSDIRMALRSSTSDEFTSLTNLSPKINSPRSELGPFLLSDGLTLMLSSVPCGGRNQHDLFFATRSAVDAPFEKTVRIGGGINTVSNEFGPCLAESDTALYFCSDRPRDLGNADIWVTRRVPKGTR
jgi:hypothetical protein